VLLTRHAAPQGGARWALGGRWLPSPVGLYLLLQVPRETLGAVLAAMPHGEEATGALLPPIEAAHEVWAAGVTYTRSREAREAESSASDVYARVYEAKRPEIFFKTVGWRVVGPEMPIRHRADSRWTVPEPELTLVVNASREIVGYCVGNDVSSRDLEGENPLYLPQAKTYDGSCALGPALLVSSDPLPPATTIGISIARNGQTAFAGETTFSRMKRSPEELVAFLYRETTFPLGCVLLTGTGVVPPDDFTLRAGDVITISVQPIGTLSNTVAAE